MTRDEIRQIFLAHGFTIKPGLDDLMPYVYEAAEALLHAAKYPALKCPPCTGNCNQGRTCPGRGGK